MKQFNHIDTWYHASLLFDTNQACSWHQGSDCHVCFVWSKFKTFVKSQDNMSLNFYISPNIVEEILWGKITIYIDIFGDRIFSLFFILISPCWGRVFSSIKMQPSLYFPIPSCAQDKKVENLLQFTLLACIC